MRLALAQRRRKRCLDRNLDRALHLIDDAATKGAEMVALLTGTIVEDLSAS